MTLSGSWRTIRSAVLVGNRSNSPSPRSRAAYQPLGWLVQSLTYQFFGLEPRGYHLVSLVFHVANVVLLHLLCVRLLERRMPELAARHGALFGWLCGIPVLLYAVHPLRVEMVAWASPQAYLPSITLSLLSTLAYLRAHPSSGEFRRSWMIVSSILIILAVLTKGSAVVLPFAFLILDAYPLGRLGSGQPSWPTVRSALYEKIPVLAFTLTLAVVAFVAKSRWLDPEVTTRSVLVGRVAQAGFGGCFYLWKTIWPVGITAYYPRPEAENFVTPLFASCLIGVLLAAAAAIRLRQRWPWLLTTLAVYILMASPYLGLARVSVTLASDRYCHAAMMAWVVAGCAGLCTLAKRRWPRPVLLGAGGATLGIAGLLMALCSAQCRVWESNEHLWGHALTHAEWSPELHHYMGTALAEDGKFELAHVELSNALRLRPHFPRPRMIWACCWTVAAKPRRPSPIFAKPGRCSQTMQWFTLRSVESWCSRDKSRRSRGDLSRGASVPTELAQSALQSGRRSFTRTEG